MNKYLKIVNNRLSRRLTNLQTKYYHLTEAAINLRNLKRDELSRAFLNLSDQLQKFITVDDLVNYIKFGKPIISYDKLNGILKNENEKIGIIVFDTETTGLVGQSSEKSIRNQIYELAAITYDYSLEESKEGDRVDYFHAKVPDENLNSLNSVTKLIIKIKANLKNNLKRDIEIEKVNPSRTVIEKTEAEMTPEEKEIKTIEDAYLMAVADNKYNPDFKMFKDKLPKDFEYVAGDLMKMLKIKSLREMTKADKEKFINFWTKEEYKVKMYKHEMGMITDFFAYIERQEKKFDKIYMVAHNLDFDKTIVLGAIKSSIDLFKKDNNNPSLLAKNEAMLVKANTLFDDMNSTDTLNGFKSLFNEKQYINKIDLLVKNLKIYMNKREMAKSEKGFVSKLLVLLTRIPKSKDPRFRSASLGGVAPASLNQDWHTAVNDVFVTVRTTKMYFTIPMIISLLIKISETYEKSKTIPFFSGIKIPLTLVKFAIKTQFNHAYDRVKKEIDETSIDVKHFFHNKEKNKVSQTTPGKIYKYKPTHPDYPDITDVAATIRETPNIKGVDMLQKLSIEKDFAGIDAEIKKAEKTGKMPELQAQMKNMGVNVSVKELHNIAKQGGFLAVDENMLSDKLSDDNKKIYKQLVGKEYYLVAEYRLAQEKKQGAQYMANVINRKYKINITKEKIVSMLKEMGVKK